MNTPRGTVAGWWDCARDAAWDGTYYGTSWDRTFESAKTPKVAAEATSERQVPKIPLPRSGEPIADENAPRSLLARLARR